MLYSFVSTIANIYLAYILLLQWGLSSLGFCSVSSDNFFVFRCTWLVLTHSWYFFVYIFFKKETDKKRWNILKKMDLLKKGEGVSLLNFEGGPGVPLLNSEGSPGVPLLNFRGVPSPIFKLWGGSRVPRSWVPGSWSHFYTMPGDRFPYWS